MKLNTEYLHWNLYNKCDTVHLSVSVGNKRILKFLYPLCYRESIFLFVMKLGDIYLHWKWQRKLHVQPRPYLIAAKTQQFMQCFIYIYIYKLTARARTHARTHTNCYSHSAFRHFMKTQFLMKFFAHSAQNYEANVAKVPVLWSRFC
jgi:hypothetical protein